MYKKKRAGRMVLAKCFGNRPLWLARKKKKFIYIYINIHIYIKYTYIYKMSEQTFLGNEFRMRTKNLL